MYDSCTFATLSFAGVIPDIILPPLDLLQLQELLHSLGRHPGLHEAIDHPGKCVEGTNENVEQGHTREHLHGEE